MKPTFFKTPADFRAWLKVHHASRRELIVGFRKKDSGLQSITYPEALDEALCYGWIDGIRRNVDVRSYSIRFTPRKSNSTWSVVNVGHVQRLMKLGKMKPSGLKLFRERDTKKSGIYSFENRDKPLSPKNLKLFKSNWKAWTYFKSQAPSYQKVARWWVVSAKREETRLRRLQSLMRSSEQSERLGQFISKK
jgi:uncharacterized protein YdeI (YjbR/CyaY-like superfamily)